MGRTESKTFLVTVWLESTFTILHVVFGTLVFSGTLFVGTKDALGIVGRYIAGVAVCRIILMYELAGLRESCDSSMVSRSSRRTAIILVLRRAKGEPVNLRTGGEGKGQLSRNSAVINAAWGHHHHRRWQKSVGLGVV